MSKELNEPVGRVPGPTICGTYNTYEDQTRKSLVDALGHVVDLELENLVQIEMGGWGTNLKLTCMPGCTVSTKTLEDGRKQIRIKPPGQ